jgi:hypothetical protein
MPKRPKVSGWLTTDGNNPYPQNKFLKAEWKVARQPNPNTYNVKCLFCGETTRLCGQSACLGCCHKMHGGWKYCEMYCGVKGSLVEDTIIPYELIDLILRYAPLFYHCAKCGDKSDQVYHSKNYLIHSSKPSDLYECSICLLRFHNVCKNAKQLSNHYSHSKICCSTCFAKHYPLISKTSFF